MARLVPILALLCACNPDPGEPEEQVGYRDWLDDGPTSGERGNVIISEILWSGSVRNVDGDWVWDPTDVFVEFRNEGALPVRMTDWRLELHGPLELTWRLPAPADPTDLLEVAEESLYVARTSGCFPEADGVIDGLQFPVNGDGFRLVLRDADERLIEPAGGYDMPPFAGGYDLVVSRSMERINLMFGESGGSPNMWHHYTDNYPLEPDLPNNPASEIPNNDLMAPDCQARTLASPGRPNSPDYSGAYASGGFE